uniref:Glycerol-3-phosphate dehydrogenase [NAD(+)] n=1 Tax=Octopus bimaculoides TaxID=37653 RepID=A0A0L8GXN2_OCTBM
MTTLKKICIVGSGNWGSAIAKIVGETCKQKSDKFHPAVNMYVYEEMIGGKKLTEIINTQHENVKYLPGYKLPTNVVAVPDVKEAAAAADILIFVIPHQFVRGICTALKGNIKNNAIAVSLIKVVSSVLNIPCAVLMGANIANEVAEENYCESTIGCTDPEMSLVLKDCFQTEYFRIVCVSDCETVEICGALKNIVAVGAGIADGLGYGDNTKAAVIRLGLMEMIQFAKVFYEGSMMSTFLESCGVADLITTCYGGRNRRVAEAFAKTGKSIEQLEQEMLNGQKLQGPPTAAEVNIMLKSRNMEDRFPLFTTIHRMCLGEVPVDKFISCLKNHPEHH